MAPAPEHPGNHLGRRVRGAAIAMAALAVLLVAGWLEPASAGVGTHEQLHLPSCGWIRTIDVPCPTCGMTTAFSHAADGHLVASLVTQPFGFLAALATAMAVLGGGWVTLTGRTTAGLLAAHLPWARIGWVVLGVFLLAWLHTVLRYRGYLG